MFEKIVRDLQLPPTSEPLKKILAYLKLPNKEELYVRLAHGAVKEEEVVRELKKKTENRFMKYWKLQFFRNDRDEEERKTKQDGGKDEEENTDIVISPCCSPIPGDDVVGMNIGGKITVHKRKCTEAIRLMASYGDKIVPVRWVTQQVMSFPAVMQIKGLDRVGVVSEITTIISKESGVNMRMVHFETKDGVFEGIIHVYVHHTDDLNRLIAGISAVKGVENVSRV